MAGRRLRRQTSGRACVSCGALWRHGQGWPLSVRVRRPPQYRKVYDEMLAQRAITCTKDEATGKYVLRAATAEELERGEEQTEARRAAVTQETRQIQAQRQGYADCSEEDKEARVLAYIERWRRGNALTDGNRNIALNKLAWSMQNAGMWDAVAQTAFNIIATNSGLGTPEIRTLMRERRKSKK